MFTHFEKKIEKQLLHGPLLLYCLKIVKKLIYFFSNESSNLLKRFIDDSIHCLFNYQIFEGLLLG